jgi:hypothetical protein
MLGSSSFGDGGGEEGIVGNLLRSEGNDWCGGCVPSYTGMHLPQSHGSNTICCLKLHRYRRNYLKLHGEYQFTTTILIDNR